MVAYYMELCLRHINTTYGITDVRAAGERRSPDLSSTTGVLTPYTSAKSDEVGELRMHFGRQLPK